MRPALLALACLALLPTVAIALSGFYLRGEEGWFWYEREPERQDEPEPSPPAAPAPAPAERTQDTASSAPPPLSSAWLRERLGAYRDRAIDDPSPDNVALYLYLQRVAMDKARRRAVTLQADEQPRACQRKGLRRGREGADLRGRRQRNPSSERRGHGRIVDRVGQRDLQEVQHPPPATGNG